jgi:hypothetical protein
MSDSFGSPAERRSIGTLARGLSPMKILRVPKVEDSERSLVQLSRQLAGRRPVLFHGTRYSASIVRSGMLLFATGGDPVISFSRSPEVAAYWADMPRDDDEGRGAVFVFDRRSLAARYRIEPFRWGGADDEMEERVWLTNIAIAPHLIGFVETASPPMTNQRSIAHDVERCSEHPGLGVRTLPWKEWEAWSRAYRERVLASMSPETLDIIRSARATLPKADSSPGVMGTPEG